MQVWSIGSHAVEAWHEGLGTLTTRVVVKPKNVTRITLEHPNR
jgi:hypothetical protein